MRSINYIHGHIVYTKEVTSLRRPVEKTCCQILHDGLCTHDGFITGYAGIKEVDEYSHFS